MKIEKFSIAKATQATRMVTRDGRNIESWRIVANIQTSFFCIEVTASAGQGKDRETYLINQNGRRWINVISNDDVFIQVGSESGQKP
jgi:hypothetical protein